MRTIFILLFFIASITSQAQNEITKEVGDFNKLKAFDLIKVNLIQNGANKVVIKGEGAEKVKVINDNGTLKIRMQSAERFNGNNIFAEVYFTGIEVIDANEGADITLNKTLKQSSIELRAQEGGMIKIDLNTNHVKTKAVTGGVIKASGTSKSQEIILNTGGVFEGRELHTEDTQISITAAGEASVYASGKVKARVTAGGDVNIYGNPQTVDQKSIVGGRIRVMN